MKRSSELTPKAFGVNEVNEKRFSGIILAGGESQRMGVDKALLTVGGQSLIRRVADVMLQVADELIVVTDKPGRHAHLKARVIRDLLPGRGPLGGIYSGLRAARYWQSLVVACDMPFLSHQLLRYLISLSPGQDVVIPCPEELLEPLHALYSKACLTVMEDLLSQGHLSILEVLPRIRVRYVSRREVSLLDSSADWDRQSALSFSNINTPADLLWAQQIMARESISPGLHQ